MFIEETKCISQYLYLCLLLHPRMAGKPAFSPNVEEVDLNQ